VVEFLYQSWSGSRLIKKNEEEEEEEEHDLCQFPDKMSKDKSVLVCPLPLSRKLSTYKTVKASI